MSTVYDWQFRASTDATSIKSGWTAGVPHSCGCVGPQRGEPFCPCRMRGVIERDGRWVEPERDLGPVRRHDQRLVGKLADATPNPKFQTGE